MKESFFVSIECSDPDVTTKIIPGAKAYGIESVMGISDSFDTDISSINASEKIAKCLVGTEHKVEDKYNQKFFPHLAERFCFGEFLDSEYPQDPRSEYAENNFMLKRLNLRDEEDELICQVAVCVRSNENPLTSLFQENDHHFTQESVSSSFVLN